MAVGAPLAPVNVVVENVARSTVVVEAVPGNPLVVDIGEDSKLEVGLELECLGLPRRANHDKRPYRAPRLIRSVPRSRVLGIPGLSRGAEPSGHRDTALAV